MGLGKVLREMGVKVGLYFDKKNATDADKKLNEVADTLRSVAVQVSAVAGTMFGFAKAASHNSRELSMYSEQLGINSERLQELEFAAKSAAGANREDLIGALEGVSGTLDSVRRGSLEAAFTFQRLGLSADIIADRSLRADQVLMMVSDRLNKIHDPIARTAIATQVFGGAGAKLIPMLMKGSAGIAQMGKEARNLGVVLDAGAIEQGKQFDITLSKIWMVLKNITFLIGHELIKYLDPMVKQFQAFIVQNKKFIASGIATVVKTFGIYLMIILKTTIGLANRFKFLVQILGGVERVSRFVAIALGIFTATKILTSVGLLISSFAKLGSILALVNLPMLGIALAVAGVLLVVEDLYTFMKGGDSVTGDLVKGMMKWAKAIQDFFAPVINFIDGLFEKMDSIGEKFGSIGKIASTGIKGLLANIPSMLPGGGLGTLFDMATGGSQAVQDAKAFRPAANAGAINNNQSSDQKNNFNAQVTVQVPPGTSAKDATQIVSGGVQDGFAAVLRQTRNQAVGGVAY